MSDTTITYSKGFIIRSYYLTAEFEDGTFLRNVLELADEIDGCPRTRRRFIRDEKYLMYAQLN